MIHSTFLVPLAFACAAHTAIAAETMPASSPILNFSGVMPSLGLVADHEPRTEAGTGAMMPWADRLWIVTYVAHTRKRGAGTGLYELREDMVLRKRPESVVGTYANRMIHSQSNQLIIGPHFIDMKGNVRTATDLVDHRLAATMAHLTDPQNKVYFLTMEGLFIECDVQTLATETLFDLNKELDEPPRAKPHFKSAFTQHGRVVVANNSYNERDHLGTWQAGRLAEWDGERWTILARQSFVEVSGKSSFGKPIYALGWDRASAILKVFLKGNWLTYRLPKGSYTYDETSTTEWTRIREVETERALVDCHGIFYELSYHGHGGTLWGIRPISTHLRMVPDFCSWRGLLVLGGNQATPMKHDGPDTNPFGGQPQAGLWFGKTDDLWQFGKPKGMGGVWHKSPVKAHAPSDGYLMLGFDKKSAHFYHDSSNPVVYHVEVDIVGDGDWKTYQRVTVPSGEYVHHEFPDAYSAHWLRVTTDRDCNATAFSFTTDCNVRPSSTTWRRASLLAVVVFSHSVFALAAFGTPSTRPNIILILTDDQRLDALGASGNPHIRTPHLDALAQRSVRFTNAHVVFSLCGPSRAAILTGRYGSANGVTSLNGSLRAGEVTFAQHLKSSGYRTALVGKWHIGGIPAEAGFDTSCFFRSNGAYIGRKVWDEGREVRPSVHVDDYCVDRSIAFLEEAAKRPEPFLLFHNTQLPHMNHQHAWPSPTEFRDHYDPQDVPVAPTVGGDLTGKPPYLERVRNRTQADRYGYKEPTKVREHIRDYYAVITQMDAMLGRLLAAVERLKLGHNTWIIFMSDNGWLLGEHRMTSKVLAYSDSVRVPLLISGPGVKPRVESRLALNLDLAPTFLELAGLPGSRAMHGTSLMPLIRSGVARWRDAFVYECLDGFGGTKPMLAAMTADWSLIQTWDDRAAVRVRPADFSELYDRRSDPSEARNVYKVPGASAVLERLEREVQNHIMLILRTNPATP